MGGDALVYPGEARGRIAQTAAYRVTIVGAVLPAPLAIVNNTLSSYTNAVLKPALSGWIAIPDVSFPEVHAATRHFICDLHAHCLRRRRVSRSFRVERNLVKMLGYALFFPPSNRRPDFASARTVASTRPFASACPSCARFTLGVALFAIGLVKKVVFADTIRLLWWIHVYIIRRCLQEWEYSARRPRLLDENYCDFSGYTDMAIGLALYSFGFYLPTNFSNARTFRSSIVEFWRRWHITLSFWLRDYLYIPLGGNRQWPQTARCSTS